jgi:uncharacterized protein YjbI with pentapeptide repeats
MADPEQLQILEQGVEDWNKWRRENPDDMIDLSGANFFDADLSEANLANANLFEVVLANARLFRVNLSKANLVKANLSVANLYEANLSGADLSDADLTGAKLLGANLSDSKFLRANLNGANLGKTNLSGAILADAQLRYTSLVEARIDNAIISNSNIYGISVWGLEGEFKEQNGLIITPPGESAITVDNIKVAQFIYLILNNKEIRDVLNTLTSKTVLILGRFALPERKIILDALRNKLREYDLLPIVFYFERPTDKDFTETIKTLAGMCYFVIADVTNPKSSPLELQATVPDYQIPFVPIIQKGENPFAMMVDLQKKYEWVLDTISYASADQLIRILKKGIIDRAMKKHDELRLIKASEPTVIRGADFEEGMP